MAAQAIIQLAGLDAPVSGNFISCIRHLARGIEDAGLRSVFVFPSTARPRPWFTELQQLGYSVYDLPRSGALPALAWRVAKIARQENAVLLHSHFTMYDVVSSLAAAALRVRSPLSRAGCRVIWHFHSPWPEPPSLRTLMSSLLKYRILGRTCHQAVVSEGGRNAMLARGLPRRRSCVLLNGIEITRATARSTSREQMRSELGLPLEAPVFLTFGWQPHRKGVDLAIRALERLGDRLPGRQLVITGGPDAIEYVDRLTAQRRPDWVHIVSSRECVGDYYGMADAFLLPSRAEGFPYSVLEAMANGVPVIASNIPGLEWATEAPGLSLCTPECTEELAQRILEITAGSEAERAQVATSAKAFVEKYFSAEAWSRQVLALYRRVLCRPLPEEPAVAVADRDALDEARSEALRNPRGGPGSDTECPADGPSAGAP